MTDVADPAMRQQGASADLDALRALAGQMFDALAASGVAVTVTDPRRHDDPIIFVNSAFELTLDQGLIVERRIFQILTASEDKAEGMAAFIEKREGQWKGR